MNSFGLGVFITKLESKLIEILIRLIRFLKNTVKVNHEKMMNFIYNYILNNKRLSSYSKIVILSCILIMAIQIFSKLLCNNKILNRCSFKFHKFFNNELTKKVSLIDKNSRIKIVNLDDNWSKIKKLVLSDNSKSNNKFEIDIKLNMPFYKIMKYFCDYEERKSKLKRRLI